MPLPFLDPFATDQRRLTQQAGILQFMSCPPLGYVVMGVQARARPARPWPRRMPASISPGRAKAACSSTFEIEGEASPPWTRMIGWSSQSKTRRYNSSARKPPYEVPSAPCSTISTLLVLRIEASMVPQVQPRPVERAQVDDLGIDAQILDHLPGLFDHGEIGQDGQAAARPHDARLAQRDAVVKILGRRDALRGVKIDMFQHQHRVVKRSAEFISPT